MLSSSIKQSKENGVHLHNNNTISINVLYYTKHTRTAIGIRGKLILGKKTLTFQCKEQSYVWDLSSISVERFRGRIHGGIIIYGQAQIVVEKKDGTANNDRDTERPTEFVFTKINQKSYHTILNSIHTAKFDREMESARRSNMHELAKSGVSLSSSLSADDQSVAANKQHLPLHLRFLRLLYLMLFYLSSFIYKTITGHRWYAPQSLHEALHNVLIRINPILVASKRTLSSSGIRINHIEKDTASIHKRLLRIQQINFEHSPGFQSTGSVKDSSTTGQFDEKRLVLSLSMIKERIFFFFFLVRRKLNLPTFQYQWQMSPTASTVSEAVKNANEKVVELRDFVMMNNKLAGESQMIEQIEHIQLLLFNIKVHETNRQMPVKEE